LRLNLEHELSNGGDTKAAEQAERHSGFFIEMFDEDGRCTAGAHLLYQQRKERTQIFSRA
jgi:hypothetical protein